jgi:DNA-binding response OmpR family regulator
VDLVFLVERSDEAAARLVIWAQDAGHHVSAAATPGEARHLASTRMPAAVVFDPALAGDDFVADVSAQHRHTAFIAWVGVYFSTRVAELLERGCDDVLNGAMPERESLARLEAAGRRAAPPSLSAAIELGPLRVDATHGEASWRGGSIRLTRRERQLLQVLAEAAGRPVAREEIYRRVWGYAMARGDRTVDVNVRRLRGKLTAAAGDELGIATQPGIGYRLELSLSDEPVSTL